MTALVFLSITILFSGALIQCAPLGDETANNREPRVWNHGYDYTLVRPFANNYDPTQSRGHPQYSGNGVFSSALNSGYAGSSSYGMSYPYRTPLVFSNPTLWNRLLSVGVPSGSYSSVNTGSFSSANGINSYGSAGTRIPTEYGSFPGTLFGSGQLFNPGYGSSLSGTGFTGSQFASGGGFTGIRSQVSGGGFSGLIHSGSLSNSAYSGFPLQSNVVSNTQSISTNNGNPINSALSQANMENAGALGATNTAVKAASKAQSEGLRGYSTSKTHAEAQGFSDGQVGTVNAKVETISTSKGTAASESIGDANGLAHGTTVGGKIKTNSNVTTDAEHEHSTSHDSPEIIRASSIKSHAGGKQVRPSGYTHVYNSGPIPETREKVEGANLPAPDPAQNVPSTILIPIPEMGYATHVGSDRADAEAAKTEQIESAPEPVDEPAPNAATVEATKANVAQSNAEESAASINIPPEKSTSDVVQSNAEEPAAASNTFPQKSCSDVAQSNAEDPAAASNTFPEKASSDVGQSNAEELKVAVGTVSEKTSSDVVKPEFYANPTAETANLEKTTDVQSPTESSSVEHPKSEVPQPESSTDGEEPQTELSPKVELPLDWRVGKDKPTTNDPVPAGSDAGNDISDDYL